jgi:serine protease Do
MKKKIFVTSLILLGLSSTLFAQENIDVPKAKKEEKVILKKMGKGKENEKTTVLIDDDKVVVNGEPLENVSADKKIRKEKKLTILVDGDNVTVNGKPVEELSDREISVLKGRADHLGLVAPHLKRGTFKGEFGNGSKVNGHFEGLDEIMQDFEMIIDDKPLNKALLGVTTEKDEKGAKITTVSKESGAEKAGLKIGDIITKINEEKIEQSEDLIKAIGKYNPEDKVTVSYVRDGKTKNTTATLGKNTMEEKRVFKIDGNTNQFEFSPNSEPYFSQIMRNSKPKIGFKVQDVEEGMGVKILDIDENMPAAKAGLQKDDIVTEINSESIKTVDDLKEKTKDIKQGQLYKVKYNRNGVSQITEIKIPKKLKTADL